MTHVLDHLEPCHPHIDAGREAEPISKLCCPERDLAWRLDGSWIDSNDFGVDSDSEELGGLFDERDQAVRLAISNLVADAHDADVKAGPCGQAPRDHPELAEFLCNAAIDDATSVSPGSCT